MKQVVHTLTQPGMSKEQILEIQRTRGLFDAREGNSYGHRNEDTSYLNPSHQNISRQEVKAAYDAGWQAGRNERK